MLAGSTQEGESVSGLGRCGCSVPLGAPMPVKGAAPALVPGGSSGLGRLARGESGSPWAWGWQTVRLCRCGPGLALSAEPRAWVWSEPEDPIFLPGSWKKSILSSFQTQ